MNYGRLALAAVAATVVDGVYGFVVYGNILSGEFARYPAIYRSSETQTPFLPLMFAGHPLRHARGELPVRERLRRREAASRKACGSACWSASSWWDTSPASTTRS